MLKPELVITKTCRSRIGYNGWGNKREHTARKQPEIGNIKQCLGFPDDHITAEYHRPAADCDRQMIYWIRIQ